MYCQECGKDLGESNICKDCDIEFSTETVDDFSEKPKKRSNSRLNIIIFILLAILLNFTNPSLAKHLSTVSGIDEMYFKSGFEILLPFNKIKYYDIVIGSLLVREKDYKILSVGALGIVIPLTSDVEPTTNYGDEYINELIEKNDSINLEEIEIDSTIIDPL